MKVCFRTKKKITARESSISSSTQNMFNFAEICGLFIAKMMILLRLKTTPTNLGGCDICLIIVLFLLLFISTFESFSDYNSCVNE